MLLSGFFCLKKNMWEKGPFFEKSYGLTPLQNVSFIYFARTSFFRSKKHSFLSKRSKNVSFWLSLLKRTGEEKVVLFEKNHGLTRWQNVDVFDFFRTLLFRSKKHSFLSRISKNVSSWFFWLKKKEWKKGRFLEKNHGLTPLQNVDFFRLCENLTFQV